MSEFQSQLTVNVDSYRKIITAAVCGLCYEAGFTHAEKAAIESLVEMQIALLWEIGRSSQAFSEINGRTSPLIGDVVMALIEMGINTEMLELWSKRPMRHTISCPSYAATPSHPKILSAGEKKPLFKYVPHHFPQFPDPHAYIRTPTHKQPVTEYEAIREKAASQKRDMERALTRFMAKTSDREKSQTHSLFPDEQMWHLFPLIPVTIPNCAYLTALLPRDQVFDDEEVNEKKKKEEKPPQEPEKSEDKHSDEQSKEKDKENQDADIDLDEEDSTPPKNENESTTNLNDSKQEDMDVYDNPFMRPVGEYRTGRVQ